MSRRHWLRPKWYVSSSGQFTLGTAYEGSVTPCYGDDPDRLCIRCRTDLNEGTAYIDPEGMHCTPCHDELHPYVPPPWWRKAIWKLDAPVDRLYWWYCERFGRRIPL